MRFEGTVPKRPDGQEKKAFPKFDNGHWQFDEQMGDGVGFIYVVRDNILDRFYLGKKLFRGMSGASKGKESSWRKYKTSSPLLTELFKTADMSTFDFICLEQYKTKGTLSYAETWSLCKVEAPTSDTWYNTLIEKVSWRVKEPISQRHKDRLEMVIKGHKFK